MKQIKCPNCESILSIKGDGKYNCPDCKCGFQTEGDKVVLLDKQSDIYKKVFAFIGLSLALFIVIISSAISRFTVNEGKDSDIHKQNITKKDKGSRQEVEGVATNGKDTQTDSEKGQEIIYTVIEVVDGDTVKVNNLGTLRLIGIDTPETVDPTKPIQCYGKEASNKAKELLLNKQVTLEFDESQGRTDKYGRTLAYIHRTDGLFFNLEMIKQGYAHEYTYSTPYKYQNEFKQAQEEARNAKSGLWGSVCGCEKGKEVSRSCTACNQLTITKTNWDCSTYTEKVSSTSCSNKCPISTPPVVVNPKPTTPKYTCDCSKSCPQISTCAEAQYQLNVCGCSKRDGDGDGIACDSTGPKCQ